MASSGRRLHGRSTSQVPGQAGLMNRFTSDPGKFKFARNRFKPELGKFMSVLKKFMFEVNSVHV